MKTVKRKNAKTKSRTIARPALRRKSSFKKSFVSKRLRPLLPAAGYAFAALILFQFLSVQLVLAFYESPTRTISVAQEKEAPPNTPTAVGLPVRIKIPSIQVNAVVRSVGLARDGTMGVPKVPRETAWYMLGPRPGEVGSAVIAGHVNWLYGAIGAFQNLKKVKPGDTITVEDDTGAVMSFVVREIRTYDARSDATTVFVSHDGNAHLNLITCDGVWNKLTRQYTKRLVVFADRVMQ